jgi:hypothetical protein
MIFFPKIFFKNKYIYTSKPQFLFPKEKKKEPMGLSCPQKTSFGNHNCKLGHRSINGKNTKVTFVHFQILAI